MKSTLYQRITAPFVEPYVRYQHADILHAIRLGTAVIVGGLCAHWSAQRHHWLSSRQAAWVYRAANGYHYVDDCL